MALTEEEKKKKLQQDISLDEWYNTNQQNIERQAQQQYEDAYVNRELMNKYLNQNLASQGLADTGIANLYAQQANTDYMNQRANIANAQQEAETNLFNQYYAKKEAEEDSNQQNIYNLGLRKVDNALTDGYLTDETRSELEQYFGGLGLNNTYTNLINQYMDSYALTGEQSKTKAQNDLYNEFDINAGQLLGENKKKYGEEGLYADQVENLLSQYLQAYNEGRITLEQKDALESYVNGYLINRKENTNLDITEDTKREIEKNTVDSNKEYDIKDLKNSIPKYHQVSVNYDNSVNIWDEGVNTRSFGNFAGWRNPDSKQSDYVEEIIRMAQEKEIENGEVVSFNFGTTLADSGNYMYYNGRFYKISGNVVPTYYGSGASYKPQKNPKGVNYLK